jgi:hypothetical protein
MVVGLDARGAMSDWRGYFIASNRESMPFIISGPNLMSVSCPFWVDFVAEVR